MNFSTTKRSSTLFFLLMITIQRRNAVSTVISGQMKSAPFSNTSRLDTAVFSNLCGSKSEGSLFCATWSDA